MMCIDSIMNCFGFNYDVFLIPSLIDSSTIYQPTIYQFINSFTLCSFILGILNIDQPGEYLSFMSTPAKQYFSCFKVTFFVHSTQVYGVQHGCRRERCPSRCSSDPRHSNLSTRVKLSSHGVSGSRSDPLLRS